MEIAFRKTGREIKASIKNRREQLEARLARRNQALDEFMQDAGKLRSYLIRSTVGNYGHGGRGGYALVGKDDISSEEREEIDQLCQRIYEIKLELNRLAYVVTHLEDDVVFSLSFEELVSYGFTP